MKTKILILSVVMILFLSMAFIFTRNKNVKSVDNKSQNDFSSVTEEELYDLEEALLFEQQCFLEHADIAESINIKIDTIINEAISNLPEIPTQNSDELDILYSKFDELRAEKIVVPEKPQGTDLSEALLLEYDEAIETLDNALLEFDEKILYQLSIDKENSFTRYVDNLVNRYFDKICGKQINKIKKISTKNSFQTRILEAKKHFKAGDKFKCKGPVSKNTGFYVIGYLEIVDNTRYKLSSGWGDSHGEHIQQDADTDIEYGTWDLGFYYGGLGIVLQSDKGDMFKHWVISGDYNQLTSDVGEYIYVRQ